MKQKDTLLIREIKDYLDNHLYDNHTIQGICRKFTINREKLQTGFQQCFHFTVHAYIVNQRMRQAAEHLLISDDSIKSIALNSGYKKQRSFNKTFKTIFNMTPAAYRKLHQSREEIKN